MTVASAPTQERAAPSEPRVHFQGNVMDCPGRWVSVHFLIERGVKNKFILAHPVNKRKLPYMFFFEKISHILKNCLPIDTMKIYPICPHLPTLTKHVFTCFMFYQMKAHLPSLVHPDHLHQGHSNPTSSLFVLGLGLLNPSGVGQKEPL